MKSFSVRSIFRWSPRADQKLKYLYEERITLWQANNIDEAIEKAEKEAKEYIEDSDDEFLGLSQAFSLSEPVKEDGIEIFSLLRESDLEPKEYLDNFFDTGYERQT